MGIAYGISRRACHIQPSAGDVEKPRSALLSARTARDALPSARSLTSSKPPTPIRDLPRGRRCYACDNLPETKKIVHRTQAKPFTVLGGPCAFLRGRFAPLQHIAKRHDVGVLFDQQPGANAETGPSTETGRPTSGRHGV